MRESLRGVNIASEHCIRRKSNRDNQVQFSSAFLTVKSRTRSMSFPKFQIEVLSLYFYAYTFVEAGQRDKFDTCIAGTARTARSLSYRKPPPDGLLLQETSDEVSGPVRTGEVLAHDPAPNVPCKGATII
jgi:hypothetical protein